MVFIGSKQVLDRIKGVALLLGEDVKVDLLHHKVYEGKLIALFVRDKDTPLGTIYLRFDKHGLERIIALPDILHIERKDT